MNDIDLIINNLFQAELSKSEVQTSKKPVEVSCNVTERNRYCSMFHFVDGYHLLFQGIGFLFIFLRISYHSGFIREVL